MIGYILGLLGMWLFSDAIYSYTLYANASTYDSKDKQTWKKDHWVRAVRGGLAIVIIVIGAVIL